MSLPELSTKDVKNLNEPNTLLIDVRGKDEYTGELGHIKGTKLITLGEELDQWRQSQTDKSQKIIFICRSGGRSGKATQDFLDAGFSHVYNMTGGMMNWNAQGFEVVR